MSAISPESRSVTENRFARLTLFSCLFGRLAGSMSTFHVAFMSFRPNSGGVGGSCCRKRAMMSTSFSESSPEVPQFGMPAGEP